MVTPLVLATIAGAAGAVIFFLSKMKESESERLKPRVERKQPASRLGTWIWPLDPHPGICRGTVLHTASDEPVTIDSIFGGDRSPFQMDHFFFRWYDATDAQGGRVSVKVYNRHPACERVFRKELDSARALVHPGIVRMIGEGRFDGCEFSVFEKMTGGTLRYWLQRYGKLTGPDVLSIVRQVAEALDFAHARGMIHSDVQPENVWLDPDPQGRAALAEFGVTQAESDVADPEFPFPEGFLQYSSPEHYSALEYRADARADIYSFSVLCYELIAGVDPWNGQGVIEFGAHPIEKKDAPDIRTLRKDVPEALAKRLIQTLRRDPESRPPTAAAVLAGVEVEIAGLGVP